MGILAKIFGLGGEGQTQCLRCAELEARLYGEIDSNRLREDEMKNALLQVLHVPTPGRRTPLTPHSPDSIDSIDSKNLPLLTTPDAELEREIDDLVGQFAAQAEERGVPYTEDDYVRVRAQLRAEYGMTEH